MAADLISVALIAQTLAQSIPSIRSTIAKSLGLKESEIQGVQDTSQLQVIVREKILEKNKNEKIGETPDETAQALGTSWIQLTHVDLSSQRKERLSQAHVSFTVALATLILGILLVFTGVILIFAVSLAVGAVTAASSIISGIVSALAFNFYKETNNRLDEITKEMSILEKGDIVMTYIDRITDPEKRDRAIEELAKKIYPGN